MKAIAFRPQQHNTLNVYRELPPGCVPFLVQDEYSMPFIRPGECVVVDTTDTTPRVGDIYVIQWDNTLRGEVRRDICQARHSSAMWRRRDGETSWHVTSMKTVGPGDFEKFLEKAAAERANGMAPHGAVPMWTGGWSDGPFDYDHLASKLYGAVIGIYQPKVQEMIEKARRTIDGEAVNNATKREGGAC